MVTKNSHDLRGQVKCNQAQLGNALKLTRRLNISFLASMSASDSTFSHRAGHHHQPSITAPSIQSWADQHKHRRTVNELTDNSFADATDSLTHSVLLLHVLLNFLHLCC